MENSTTNTTATPIDSDKEECITAAIDCLIWQGSDGEGGSPDDFLTPEDIEDGDMTTFKEEAAAFYDDAMAILEDTEESHMWGPEQIGHDFVLSRNRHGAGFWDRYYKGPLAEIGDKLHEAAKAYGSTEIVVYKEGKEYYL